MLHLQKGEIIRIRRNHCLDNNDHENETRPTFSSAHSVLHKDMRTSHHPFWSLLFKRASCLFWLSSKQNQPWKPKLGKHSETLNTGNMETQGVGEQTLWQRTEENRDNIYKTRSNTDTLFGDKKEKISSERQFSWKNCLIDVNGQRKMSDRKATVAHTTICCNQRMQKSVLVS